MLLFSAINMDIQEFKKTLRRINRDNYPELQGYSDEEIWRDRGGPGALYLAARMSRYMSLQKGDKVLDLGCGEGESSIFLAKHFGVGVVAADLWTDAEFLHEKFERRGFGSQIVPMNLDAREQLPFSEGAFDAIFCMNSLSFIVSDAEELRRLTVPLKRKGCFCAGGECMNREFSERDLRNPPEVYNFVDGVWEDDFLRLHCPLWWRDVFAKTGVLEIKVCEELDDGSILYEEEIMAKSPEGYLGLSPQEAQELEIRQIIYGRENEPRMTIYLAAAVKKIGK
jgi:SAM-dependent methyltransferase